MRSSIRDLPKAIGTSQSSLRVDLRMVGRRVENLERLMDEGQAVGGRGPIWKDSIEGTNDMEHFDLLTLAEVAKLLQCSKAHVSNAVAGRVRGCAPIPSVSLGRRKLVRRESLAEWIERNEATNGNLGASPERGRKSA